MQKNGIRVLIVLLLLTNVLLSAPQAPADTDRTPSMGAQASNIADGVKAGAKDTCNWLTGYLNRLGRVLKQEVRAVRGRDMQTGESLPDSGIGWWQNAKTRVRQSALPAAGAAVATIGASYFFEQLFKTNSRWRNKKIVCMLTLLNAWYGTWIQRRRHITENSLSNAAVYDRLVMVGLLSFLGTLGVSIITHWGSFDEKDQKREKKYRMSLRKHLLWALEVGVMQVMATSIGYGFDRLASKQPAPSEESAVS